MKKNHIKEIEKHEEQISEVVHSHRIPVSLFLISTFIGVGIIGISACGLAFESYAASDQLFPGVMIGNLDVGGRTRAEAREIILQRQNELMKKGITVFNGSKRVNIPLEEVALDPDIPLEALSPIFNLDSEKTLSQAFAVGRHQGVFMDYMNRVGTFFHTKKLNPVITFNTEVFEKALRKEFFDLTTQSQAAQFLYSEKEKKVFIVPEKSGKDINIQKGEQESRQALLSFVSPSFTLSFIEKKASPTLSDLSKFLPDVQTFLQRPAYSMTYEKDHWKLSPEKIVQWLTSEKKDGSYQLSLDREKIKNYLLKEIEPKVSVESLDSRFEMKDGKVTILQAAQKGRKLLVENSVDVIIQTVMVGQASIIPLAVQEIEPTVQAPEDLADVKEIIGEAVTDFKGSPKNRKFNIAHGAKKVHGVILKSGEEFSLISHLGPIDETSGFLPELVIKGDRTKPEFGGGLCQLSTTLFRAVSLSGVQVLERRNHSYRVSYYEPPIGYDATIYFPKPDFRFKNDTKNTILIQSEIQGTKLKITLWGTKDGRIVEIDKPTVFNRKKPPAEKIVETPDLKPGERKCLEKAHEGADAVFERRVKLASGEVWKDTFKSHYVPWQAICLVGKKEAVFDTKESAPQMVPPDATVTNPTQQTIQNTTQTHLIQQNSESKPEEQEQKQIETLPLAPINAQ